VRKSEYLDYKSNAFVSSLANHKSQNCLGKITIRVLEIRSARMSLIFIESFLLPVFLVGF